MIAIDPGSTESALVVWDGKRLLKMMKADNQIVRNWLITRGPMGILAIEKVASYGMAVGEEVFETVYWSGRFAEAYTPGMVERITRMEVKMHLCHHSRAKDGNIRQALIDRFGVVGTKKNQGPLYGVSGDLWAALAVAVTAWDQKKGIV